MRGAASVPPQRGDRSPGAVPAGRLAPDWTRRSRRRTGRADPSGPADPSAGTDRGRLRRRSPATSNAAAAGDTKTNGATRNIRTLLAPTATDGDGPPIGVRADACRLDARLSPMRLSTISKQVLAGPGSPLRRLVGREIRRLPRARGLSQARARRIPSPGRFVSSVEAGRTVPSLAALVLLTDRLDVIARRVLRGGQPRVDTRCTLATMKRPSAAGSSSTTRPGPVDRKPDPGAPPARRAEPAAVGRGPLHEGLHQRPRDGRR